MEDLRNGDKLVLEDNGTVTISRMDGRKSLNELIKVKGIGLKKLEAIKTLVSLD